MKKLLSLTLALSSLYLVSCKQGDGFETSANGLRYKLVTQTKGKLPEKGDILTLEMVYKTSKDSVLYSTYKANRPVKTPLNTPSFKGGLEEGFGMLAIGDSGVFEVNADSLFTKTFQAQTPPFIEKGSMITFYVKMVDFKSKKDIEDQEKKLMDDNKNKEGAMISDYVAKHFPTLKPTASGIYYNEIAAGKGPKAQAGNAVSVNYTGTFMDGKVFDSSQNSGKPIEIRLGQKMVIEGWEEVLTMMNKGAKATIVIPSALAYGSNGARDPRSGEWVIQPFTPLVFELEVVNINTTPMPAEDHGMPQGKPGKK